MLSLSAIDVDAPDVHEIWGDPRFDIPVLGLTSVSAGEIIVAARAFFAGRPSLGDHYFARAVSADRDEAVELWCCCLEAGDPMGHYGLGCTYLALGRFREAYRHLRYYTGLAPESPWAWCSYARAAEAVGLEGEARAGYRRAIELGDVDDEEPRACDLLEALDARRARRRFARRRRSRRR